MANLSSLPFDWSDEYTTHEDLSLGLLNLLELVGHLLLECPFSALNFRLILSSSVLHPNLKFILLCQSFCIFTRGFGRTVLQLFRFSLQEIDWRGTASLQYFYGTAIYVRNFLAHILVLERIMATLFVKRYEQWRNPYFTVGWFIITVTLAVLNVTTIVSFSVSETSLFNWLITGLSPTLCLLECFALYWLWIHNDKLYQNKFVKMHDLNERYQLAENIRTAKQLTPTLLLHFLNIFLGALLNWLVFYNAFNHQFYYALANQSVFTFVTYNNFLIELTMITNHPFLRRSLMSKMCINGWRSNRVGQQQKGTTMALKDLRGASLVRKLGQDEYFEQLKEAWGTEGRRVVQTAQI